MRTFAVEAMPDDLQAMEAILLREQRERLDRGEAELLRLESEHELNGYDKNVLAHWKADGFRGKRPVLSFEMQAGWQRETQQQNLEILRHAWGLREERQRLEKAQEEARRRAEEERQWREANPLQAEAMDAVKAAKYRRQAEAWRQQEEAEAAERRRVRQEAEHRDALMRAARTKEGVLAMDETDFLKWCELAPVEEVEAFAALLEKDGRRSRLPAWQRWLEDVLGPD